MTAPSMRTVYFAFLVIYKLDVCVQSADTGKLDKRILLSDPEYVQQQLTHLQAELQSLQVTVLTQTSEISSLRQQMAQTRPGGVTFVRWGRTDCPVNITDLVYSGYAGGSYYDETGGAANHVCLPRDPVWGAHKSVASDDYAGRMYGAEYESNNGHSPFGQNVHNQDVPCAVCRATTFTSSIMIPGRAECYGGWTEAYRGDLASGYYKFSAPSEYVCVDEHVESLDGGIADQNGVLFFGVKAECGSLRCPPYEQDKYLSCVVCMK
ncbi:short-chain collagen C4-like [Mizuhopecten yessoensis]|uniref:Short-chain collagen C4 n=1 Tax=Mizuhopecten yessoensis TaxID=6573 RepID=A0A210PUW2_MIZYE|nr:short-chain collagen C4-like [Mizuhopecten yessoensis]OWF40245.1 hypothetical protein KP79_PYT16770 [Mizuhopecten yessoensis]